MRISIEEARRLNLIPVSRKGGKYNNQKTTYNGKEYDSKKEAKRAWELDLLLKSGNIKGYETQPRYPIIHNGIKICTYIGDFLVTKTDGSRDLEDVKGVKTAVYVLKKKLVKAYYGIDIKEI